MGIEEQFTDDERPRCPTAHAAAPWFGNDFSFHGQDALGRGNAFEFMLTAVGELEAGAHDEHGAAQNDAAASSQPEHRTGVLCGEHEQRCADMARPAARIW